MFASGAKRIASKLLYDCKLKLSDFTFGKSRNDFSSGKHENNLYTFVVRYGQQIHLKKNKE